MWRRLVQFFWCVCMMLGLWVVWVVFSGWVDPFATLDTLSPGKDILTHSIEDVIDTNAVDDPIVSWLEAIAGWWKIKGLYDPDADPTGSTFEKITNIIKTIVNYALSIIGLVAMVYLIYHGFLVMTAGTNEEQAGKWRWGIKYAAIAIVGIAISWFIVDFILRLIWVATGSL